MSRRIWVGFGATLMVVLFAGQGLAGDIVGPPPSNVLREFGQFTAGLESTYVISHDLHRDHAEADGVNAMAKIGICIIDRIDLELMGGVTSRDVESEENLEDFGTAVVGGVGVNANFWTDRITGIDLGINARITECSPNGGKWTEWQIAATLARPCAIGEKEEALTPYVGVKFSQVDIEADLRGEGGSMKLDEARRAGGLIGVRYALGQRYELVGEIQFVDQTAVGVGFRTMF